MPIPAADRPDDYVALLEARRAALGYSLEELARFAGVSSAAIREVLERKRPLGADLQQRLADALELSDEDRKALADLAQRERFGQFIWYFADYPEVLESWKAVSGRSHAEIVEAMGQFDSGLWSNLIQRRRRFTPELQGIFTTLAEFMPPEARHLRLLVDRSDAEQYEQDCRLKLQKRKRELSRERESTRRINAEKTARAAHERAVLELKQLESAIRASLLLHEASSSVRVVASLACALVTELASCADFRADAPHLARRLGGRFSVPEVADALQLLSAAGVLTINPEGTASVHEEAFVVGDQIPRVLVQRYYQEVCAEVGRAVEEMWTSGEAWRTTELGAVTMALPSSAIPRFKALLRAFRETLAGEAAVQEGQREEVYQIFFCLSQVTAAGEPAADHLDQRSQ